MLIVLFALAAVLFTACDTDTGRNPAVTVIPDAPALPEVVPADSQLTVTWITVENATAYEVWYNTSLNTGSAVKWGDDVAETTATITELTNGTTLYIWIKAKNLDGTSGFSPAAYGTPVAATEAPEAPEAPDLTEGDTLLGVAWNAVEGATAYEVWYHTAINAASAVKWGSDVTATTATITGLTNGTAYYVWIKAKNSTGTSGFSPVATATPEDDTPLSDLDAPLNVSVTAGNTFLTATWSAVTGATAYEVWINTADDTTGATKKGSDVTGTTATLPALVNGTTYYVWVKAKNGTATSGFSTSDSGTPVAPVAESLVVVQAETMTASGSYAGPVASPFSGMGLYGNSDTIQSSFNFPTIPGLYRLDVRGASNNSNTARASVYLDTLKIGEVTFTGTAADTSSLAFSVTEGTPGNRTVKIICENDTGAWDVFIDSVELFFEGTPLPDPELLEVPTEPVWESGSYRNLFVEIGKSETEVEARINETFDQLFYGSETEKIYYETGTDMAYIYTADTNDVRSEGMSYGMMICVQLDKKAEFDRLWKFAKTYMQHQTGARTGYFAWQINTDGTIKDNNSAPDGEEYFAMSLYFAWKRWGNGTGIYNYQAEADNILNHMVRHRELVGLAAWDGSSENMIAQNNSNGRLTAKQVVFVPYGASADHTDPSYHLPAFYELWSRWAAQDNTLWGEVADESRLLFQNACHSVTGLAPDYSLFDGTPTGGEHMMFRYDAFRVAMNIALDSVWWNQDSWQRDTWVDNLLGFFESQGITSYKALYNIDGTGAAGDHSPGLVAMNATAALISDDPEAWRFVEELWNTSPTTGTYRYYDGCLYMFGMLVVSGNYRIIGQ
jgi:endo-1,4-beta-D-glucanase Y